MTSVRNVRAGRWRRGIFCSFYSACIGGATQDPNEAMGGSVGGAAWRARNVGAVDVDCPKYSWPTMAVSKRGYQPVHQELGSERNGFGYLLWRWGRFKSVVIAKRNGTTGRPTELTLTDVAGKSAPIRAEEFRLRRGA